MGHESMYNLCISGSGKDDADDIETSINPVYGIGRDNFVTNNDDILMSRNPVYGTSRDNFTTVPEPNPADYDYIYVGRNS